MRPIDKFIAKLHADIQAKILAVLMLIDRNDLEQLDVRKLQGGGNAYRVRVGRIRIKFYKLAHGNEVFDVNYRTDTTY